MRTNELTPDDWADIRQYWFYDGQFNEGTLLLLDLACQELAEQGLIVPYADVPLPYGEETS